MTFTVGQPIRWKPGFGVYGFEDSIEADGRLPGVVIGLSAKRVRIELTLEKRRGAKVQRSVNAASLIAVAEHAQETR